jgi:ketosteroid isomerase-like protein
MITDSDVTLVLQAYARGDIDAAIADLSPAVAWIEPDEFPNGGPRPGPATVAEATVTDVYTVRDGLVVRMQAYADPAAVLPAGG